MGGSLPNVADELPAGLVAAAVGVLHQALRGRDDADPKPVQDARDVGVAEVKAAARRRSPKPQNPWGVFKGKVMVVIIIINMNNEYG